MSFHLFDRTPGSRRFLLLVMAVMLLGACRKKTIDFSADVKPILNKHCISCHGGVKRNGNFSVLFRSEALDTTESGRPAILPGDPAHSEMIRRITSTDPEERMPYKEEPLTAEQIDILTTWIAQGAPWGDHWAYIAPKETAVPGSHALSAFFSNDEWAHNEIDRFVLHTLEARDLKPSPPADKASLLRRACLDITGLPPTEEQAKKFLNDTSPDAYEHLVDELLASPRYGEKWASWWLDLARYSDTKGYERDAGRTIWRYRDWVIRAFNNDMPFDQFTLEQLAGDLLDKPTDDQWIATAFHRNTMNNDEGGTEDEEFRTSALIDRVSTTWEVWQSTTMACVQCHTHPYDPFVHDEYYKSLAFFNNTRDEDTEGEHPNLRTYEEKDQQTLEAIRRWISQNAGEEKAWENVQFLKTLEPKYHPHDFDKFINGELIDTKWLGIRPGGSARLRNIDLTNKKELFIRYWTGDANGSFQIHLDRPDGNVVARAALSKTDGRKVTVIPLNETTGTHDLYFTFQNPSLQKNQSVCAIEWFAFREALPGKSTPQHAGMSQSFLALLNAPVGNTPVMVENSDAQLRETHVFERGNWLVKGKVVSPDVPRALNAFPATAPRNRLGFAQWLMNKENPLTARVIVNRVWEQIFGYGIVETLEDFGTQGAPPSHPELLDWLALRMMNDYQWSIKKLVRTIVLSSTYRQASFASEEQFESDPTNKWLARGPRVRLSAEEIRDQALQASGLLSTKMYGESVMPYQPAGIWNTVYNGAEWKMSKGEDQYRRAVYIYSKRTSPYPAMMTFDGSSREVCLSRRIRTNTPLQSLVTLNDSSYVVMARSLARRIAQETPAPAQQIRRGYDILLHRSLTPEKLSILSSLYGDALKTYKSDPAAAEKLMADHRASPELAALTVVTHALLNLDEVITKE